MKTKRVPASRVGRCDCRCRASGPERGSGPGTGTAQGAVVRYGYSAQLGLEGDAQLSDPRRRSAGGISPLGTRGTCSLSERGVSSGRGHRCLASSRWTLHSHDREGPHCPRPQALDSDRRIRSPAQARRVSSNSSERAFSNVRTAMDGRCAMRPLRCTASGAAASRWRER